MSEPYAEGCWYSIRNQHEDEAEVMIYDAIGAYGISADSFVGDLRKVTAKTIRVRLNTPGGSVFDGTAIHNALKEHPAKVIAQVDGVAASAGSFIAMAGDEVRMADNAYMMIHNAAGGVMGGSEDMRRYADLLEKMNDTIAGMYQKKTGKGRDHWRNLMSAETWFTADEAKAEGLADAVYASTKKQRDAKANFDFTIYNKIPDAVQTMWGIKSEQSATEVLPLGETAVAQPQETPTMADPVTTVPTAQPLAAVTQVPASETVASLNASAIQGYIDRGRALGREEGKNAAREEFGAIMAACPGEPRIAADAFMANQSPQTAALIFSARADAKREAAVTLENMQKENARLHSIQAAGGNPGVPFTASSAAETYTDELEPEVRASLEYDGNATIRAQNPSKNKWMLYRVNQLKGGVRILSNK